MELTVLVVALLMTLSSAEPPVTGTGYNYRQPGFSSPGYNSPANSYIPPSSGYNPPTNYLPPAFGANNNFGQSGSGYNNFGQSGNGHNGFGHSDSGHNNFGQSGSGHNGYGHSDSGHDSYDHGHGHESEVPKSYEFGYSVKDAQSGNDYGRRESSDGNVVRGEYRVQLPDGRTQIVTYHADWKTGFHADVRYEGEARYPEPVHNNNNGGYNYNTPSDFSGSLTGFQNSGDSYRPSTAYGPPGHRK